MQGTALKSARNEKTPHELKNNFRSRLHLSSIMRIRRGSPMIVSFSVSNFRSFNGEETLSLVASGRLGASHPTHTVAIPGSDEKVLRACVMYGANGAGKSNLFRALEFAKSIACDARSISGDTGRQPFRLGGDASAPSCFDLQFIADSTLYRWGFKADNTRILEEWLVRVSPGRERVVYERTTDDNGVVEVKTVATEGEKLKALATVGGPQNQSFLATVAATLDAENWGEDLTRCLRWFQGSLILVGPSHHLGAPGAMLAADPQFREFTGHFLSGVGTGVDRLIVEREEFPEEHLRGRLPSAEWARLLAAIESGAKQLRVRAGNEEFLIENRNGLHIYRMVVNAAHATGPDTTFNLDMSQESDGTQRLLDLVPALYNNTNSEVFFVDELDRSLHPLLSKTYLRFFLDNCTASQRQLIVTTHESTLLDLNLLRRDEIWFIQKDENAATRIYSLADFRVRNDLSVRKHYLEGRFGAIPFVGSLENLRENIPSTPVP